MFDLKSEFYLKILIPKFIDWLNDWQKGSFWVNTQNVFILFLNFLKFE
jgi:hypothetical protein